VKKLVQIVRGNKSPIILYFLGGFIIIFIIPFFLNIQKIKKFFLIKSPPILLIIVILTFLFLLTYNRASNLWRKYKNNYKLKNPFFTYIDNIAVLLLSCLLFGLIFKERLFGNISFSPACLDILKILGGFVIIWFICTYLGLFISKEEKEEKKGVRVEEFTPIFSDEAITHESEDILGRKSFINDLYEQIINLPFSDSFVVGLYGAWGEGKTSALNLLHNKLIKDEGVILVEFDPWYFRNQEALLRNFYQNIENAINNIYFLPNFNRIFRKYQSILAIGLKKFGVDSSFIRNSEELKEIRKRIDSYIQRTERKLIIFIDDIDRLPFKETLSVFKLVKLSAKFKNTIFLLSFDPLAIMQNFKDSLIEDASFLEKIVQQPIELPGIEQFDIDKFLFYSYPDEGYKSAIDRLFEELNIDKEKIQEFDKDFPIIYNSQIRKLFRTLRHAKRYINGLRLRLPPVKNEINLYDFFILEAIRIFYPAIYNDIWTYPWYYIPAWSEEEFFLSPFHSIVNDDEKYKQIKQHIEKLIANKPNKSVILELLKTIFPVEVEDAFGQVGKGGTAETYRTEKRITHPDCFKKYFMLKVPRRELSDELVESTIKLWNTLDKQKLSETLKNAYLDFRKKNKLLQFFEKLPLFFNLINSKIIKVIIKSLYQNVDRFSEKRIGDFGNSEYREAGALLVNLIDSKVDKPEIQSVVEEVVGNVKVLEFAVRFVSYCKKEGGSKFYNIYENINFDKLKEIASDRLKTYFIENKKDIFKECNEQEWGIILFQWGTNWESFDGKNKKEVNAYVFGLIDQRPEYIGKIVNHFINQEPPHWKKYIDYDRLAKLYDIERLYNKIEEQKEKGYSNSAEQEAINLFLKGYKEKTTSKKK